MPRATAPLLSDDRNAVLTAAGMACLDVFTKHGLELGEAFSVVARVAGHLEGAIATSGELGTTVADMHEEFSERVAEERERWLQLHREKAGVQ
ncbi:MAG TPA: hypothetical protein VGH28_14100 [Polyangiaceae bacterium]|jgi:hypothetical protein